jgi:hypothetical protein
MPRSLNEKILHSIGFAIVAVIGLDVGWATAYAASPEDEIARLNRVRQSLFEDLVKARAETAAVRAEMEAAIKARVHAESELARMKQEAASASSGGVQTPNPQANSEPRNKAGDEVSATSQIRPAANAAQTDGRRSTARPLRRTVMPPASRTVASAPQRRVVQAATSKRTASRQTNSSPNSPASATRAQELPNVLRLQNSQ